MRSVCICGLYLEDYKDFVSESQLRLMGGLWVVNDWYQFTPWISAPDKIWNIHTEHIHPSPERYVWDWKKWYNKSASKGSEIVVRKKIDGVENQRFFDEENFKKHFGPEYAQGSISILICQALLDGFEEINIIGFALKELKYHCQIMAVINAIECARSHGVKVNVHPAGRETEWAIRLMSAPQPDNFSYYWEQ